jgi:arylsulfatase
MPESHARPGSPNIVIILLDDVGYSDFGCYGGEIETPNIDRLAANGLRYSNFRTTAICSPTRAALLTGLNHHSAGMGFLADFDGGSAAYRGDLTQEAATVAERLREAGYSTLMVGKWHVNSSRTLSQNGPMHNWPAQRGFERCYWFNLHSNDYFNPYDMYEGNSMVQVGGEGYYITDDFTDRAIDYISNQKAISPRKPFLLYLAYNAAHSPLQARAEDRDKYRGRYDIGWDRVRSDRLAKQKRLGIAPEHTELPPRNPGVAAWDTLGAKEKKLYARYMEVYAGVVDRVDQNIGRLTRFLESIGELDNTLFMVLSDNGASAEGTAEGTPNLMLTAYAQPLSVDSALGLFDVMGGPETFPHYPRGWAMASNTPFKMYKQYTFLGGVCDPLVVHWPKGVPTQGEIRRQYAHVIDICPTVLDAAGVELSPEHRGRPAKPVEGVSFAHTFREAGVPSRHTEQYYEMGGQRAMYADGWRIVTWHKRGLPYERDVWQLYDLSQDFNEMRDLAAQLPEKVRDLEQRWYEAARRYGVLPLDDRNFWLKIIESRRKTALRERWEYVPPLQPICSHAAPLTGGRSHTIRAEITRPRENADGVLVAYGSRYYGYALYILDGRLVYEIALAPRAYRLETEKRLPTGRSVVSFEMRMTERPMKGIGTLYVDGHKLAENDFDEVMVGVPYEGLDLGADRNVPVSARYRAPFAFAGTLHRVTFEVDVAPPTREELERDARMIQMMS